MWAAAMEVTRGGTLEATKVVVARVAVARAVTAAAEAVAWAGRWDWTR